MGAGCRADEVTTRLDECSVTVQRLNRPAALQAIRDEWEVLAREIGDTHPASSCDWVFAWWQFLESRKEELAVYAVRRREHLIAVIPCTFIMIKRFGVSANLIRTGIGSFFSEPAPLLVRPADEEEAVVALELALRQERYDVIHFVGLIDGGVAMQRLLSLPRAEARPGIPIQLLLLPTRLNDLTSGLSRKMRRTLRTNSRALRQQQKVTELSCSTSPADVSAAAVRFLDLYSSTSYRTGSGAALLSPHGREMFFSILGDMAEMGILRLYELTLEGRTCAMRIAFRQNATLFLHLFAAERTRRPVAPLTQLHEGIFRSAMGEQVMQIQLTTGNARYARRWRPCMRMLGVVAVWRGGWRGAAFQKVRRLLRHLRPDA